MSSTADGGSEGAGMKQPLLEAGSRGADEDDLATENEHSYTEFYTRLGTQEEELTIGSGLGAASASNALHQHHLDHRGSVASSSQDQESTILTPDRDSPVVGGTPMERRFQSSTARRPQCPSAISLCIFATVLLLAIALLWWVSGGSKNVYPPGWEPAPHFEVSFVMTLSSGLEEPGVVMMDSTLKKMRLSYYSGMTTYIYSATGPSWSIIPTVDHLTCFEQVGPLTLPAVFPNLAKFKYTRTRELSLRSRRGLPSDAKVKDKKTKCAEWIYRAVGGVDEAYQGTYTVWTLPNSNNLPVRFTFVGRSVVFGASHFDNFTIDYYDYRDLSSEGGVDPFWLRPPHGMPCRNVTHPSHHVHSEDAHRDGAVSSSSLLGVDEEDPSLASSVARGWTMLFPEEDALRDEAYSAFHRAHSVKERSAARALTFHQTRRLVEAHNRDRSKSYTLGLNRFADWSLEERLSAARQGLKRELWSHLPKSECTIQSLEDILAESKSGELPNELDYIEAGLVRPPSEQGACGASWAVALTGAIEAQIAKKTSKPPLALSAQNLIDCAGMRPLSGLRCEAGLDYIGYMWAIRDNEGLIATEASYPRLDQPGFCHFDIKRKLVADGAHSDRNAPKITECVHVSEAFSSFNSSLAYNAEDLIKALNVRLNSQGPLAVNVDISPHDFFFYKSGVYSSPECSSDAPDLEHGMLAVGYDLTGPTPFTRVRNTWGVSWGEGGFARIAQKGNTCGVATAATFVRVV